MTTFRVMLAFLRVDHNGVQQRHEVSVLVQSWSLEAAEVYAQALATACRADERRVDYAPLV